MTLDVVDEPIEKVTTEKIKNAGRQEWGRKLGKMQKELKLKKLQESSLEPPSEAITHKTQYLKWEYLLTAVGISIGLGALYYQKKSYDAQVGRPTTKNVPLVVETQSRFSDF
jgi:hypothetical protein